jgi:DNA mismatch repair ATPase MutS
LRDKQEGTIEEIAQWIQTESGLSGKKWLNIARFLLPVLNICAFFYYLNSGSAVFLGTGVILSWIIIGSYGKYIHGQHSLIGRKQSILNQYASILREFHKVDAASSELLIEILNISANGEKEISHLSRLTNLFDQRLNLLVNFFLNSLFLYDIHCMFSLEQWKKLNRDRFPEWINTVGEIEMLNSLAAFSFNNPQYCFPHPRQGKPMISGTGLGHPMIPESEAVTNDITAGQADKLLLVTGSNMSGKSTFLRTVGINLLLAQCGSPVCAESFAFTPMLILSSIRISDSLQEHTSYFMAELKRLRDIIGFLESGNTALVLIDEVLRGTNSIDKTHGSEAFIKKLVNYECLSLFATHDLSLSELETEYPGTVSNYCFESTIINGELLFDYKLRKGVATNKNATFLMQKMGII